MSATGSKRILETSAVLDWLSHSLVISHHPRPINAQDMHNGFINTETGRVDYVAAAFVVCFFTAMVGLLMNMYFSYIN